MKNTFLYVLASLTVVGVLFFNGSSRDITTGFQVGDLATNFSLPGVDGKMVSMDDFGDAKGIILVFTCNTCPYAKAYESRIMDLDKNYSSKGFPVIAINPNDITQSPGDSMEEMIARSQSKQYTFPYLRDNNQEVTKAYGASKTPHVYVLNKEAKGKYRIEYIGAIDDSPREPADVKEKYVEEAINSLLAGTKPIVTEKRAIGCTIKWADS